MDIWRRNVSGTLGGEKLTGKVIVYEESAPYSSFIKAIITLVFAVLAFSYFFAVFGYLVRKVPEEAQIALLLAASLYALVMWGFFSMKFRITDNGVEAAMPPFRYRVPFSEINDVNTIQNIPWYVGWGVRLWGRRLSFISMRKSAVEIEKKSGFFRRLVLTTQDPEKFAKMLRENLQ